MALKNFYIDYLFLILIWLNFFEDVTKTKGNASNFLSTPWNESSVEHVNPRTFNGKNYD